MNAAIEEQNASIPLDTCTVVVIYDNTASRARAMTACDFFVNQFWENVELEFHWWRTDFLQDPGLAGDAAKNATESDFLIVCLGEAGADLATLEAWFENWIAGRQGREGVLLDLSATDSQRNRQTDFLREICGRGSFDYLTPAPAPPAASMPRSPAGQTATISSAIEERRHHSRPPSRFGLNE